MTGEFDIFLSHAAPDKPWVLTLAERLKELGLRVFVDALEIRTGDNWVIRLSDALERSRYMVLVLSDHTKDRPWVLQEWTSFIGCHGPLGRLLPVKIDAVDLPSILGSTQALNAIDRDAQRAANELFKEVGDPATVTSDDARRLVLGRDLVFTLSRDENELQVIPPSGETRRMLLPWKRDGQFGIAHLLFSKLHQTAIVDAAAKTELFRHARTLGGQLFEVLFDESGARQLLKLIGRDRPRPVIQVRSDDALLLALPWELLHHEERFLVREGQVDLLRSTRTEVAGTTLLKEPTDALKLVVNVSAPEGSTLSYEAESYRITLATAERCTVVPTELGTLADLVQTVEREAPTGIHFSGHGKPGALLFESDEGRDHVVSVEQLLDALHRKLPDERPLPPFFYLASCHGNDPAELEKASAGSASAAVQLHQAGVTEVVGYFGPIVDELSTRAEEELYEAIAEGRTTRDAVRLARAALAKPLGEGDERHRPGATRAATAEQLDPGLRSDSFPFAWAQLVCYRRGPEWPLSKPIPLEKRHHSRALRRTFEGFGERRVLRTGFIGRRAEQHRVRRRLREGARTLVFQGLGGLGKSTLAQHVLPWLTVNPQNICTLWCQETEGGSDRAERLVKQLLEYCWNRFRLGWEGVIQKVDQQAGNDTAQRFMLLLQNLTLRVPELVLYFDNLESLFLGPDNGVDATAFEAWSNPALRAIWQRAHAMARDSDVLYLVASCRYGSPDFEDALLSLGPLPEDALFRLTEWFPALGCLAAPNRARLVDRLDGHPRAVEFANDLLASAREVWRNNHGEWTLADPHSPADIMQEWDNLVEPALPKVEERLREDLLLQAIWDRVLDQRAQRFLYRMTYLRRPAQWVYLGLMGEEDEPIGQAYETAKLLKKTSLLEQIEFSTTRSDGFIVSHVCYGLHGETARFIRDAHPADTSLALRMHVRIGSYFESEARAAPRIDLFVEGGYHLFEAGEYDRAFDLIREASDWFGARGWSHDQLQVLMPLVNPSIMTRMQRKTVGQLLGTLGAAQFAVGEIQNGIESSERALGILRGCGDRHGEGSALGNLGIAHARLEKVDEAINYCKQALEISRELRDRKQESIDIGNLGVLFLMSGSADDAEKYFDEQLEISRKIGATHLMGSAIANIGNIHYQSGRFQNAVARFEEALALFNQAQSLRDIGSTFCNLGSAYSQMGKIGRAIKCLEKALEISRKIADSIGECNALSRLGKIFASINASDKAIELLQTAKSIAEKIPHPEVVSLCNQELAKFDK